MEDLGWFFLFLAGVIGAMLGRHWYRRRVAAKLADKILVDVLKEKDSFRRR